MRTFPVYRAGVEILPDRGPRLRGCLTSFAPIEALSSVGARGRKQISPCLEPAAIVAAPDGAEITRDGRRMTCWIPDPETGVESLLRRLRGTPRGGQVAFDLGARHVYDFAQRGMMGLAIAEYLRASYLAQLDEWAADGDFGEDGEEPPL